MRYRDNNALAHSWANGHSTEGTASNFFFEGATIYSYGRHFPIATISGNCVYVTLQTYSKSTSRHRELALSAVSHKTKVFVQHVPTEADLNGEQGFIRQNVNYWIAEIRQLAEQYAQHPRRNSLLKAIGENINRIRQLIDVLGIATPPDLAAVLDNPDLQNLAVLSKKQKEVAASLEKQRHKKQLEKFNRLLSEWRKGDNARLPGHPADPNLAFLRIDPNGGYIETSKGMHVALPVAQRFYEYICRFIAEGSSFCSYSILNFQVEAITPDQIKVGCHTIRMKEIRKITASLGWTGTCEQ